MALRTPKFVVSIICMDQALSIIPQAYDIVRHAAVY